MCHRSVLPPRLIMLVQALILAGAMLGSPASYAQQAGKMYRLGWLQNAPSNTPFYRDFVEALHGLGYVEGDNIEIIVRSAQGRLDRLPALAHELVDLHPDVLFTGGDQGLRAAKDASDRIPIAVVVCDPLDALVASIARPGGKATGLTCISSELAGKRLQLMRELVPSLSQLAVLYNPGDQNKASELRQVQAAAGKLDVALTTFEARSAEDIDRVFTGIDAGRFQAMIILTDTLMVIQQKRIADLALRARLPAMFGFREFADSGGLVTYGASLQRTYRRAAVYIDKILHGADPGSIPIEEPTRFDLVINQKTARLLGLTVPPSLLVQADDVIE